MSKTLDINITADSMLRDLSPDFNYGAGIILTWGVWSGAKVHVILRVQMPDFVDEITSVKLRIYKNNTQSIFYAISLIDSPETVLWIEGTKTGATSTEGVTWNDYVFGYPWNTGGGDFDVNPIAIEPSIGSFIGWIEIDIPIALFNPQPNQIYTFILYNDSAPSFQTMASRESIQPVLRCVFDVDIISPDIFATTIDSTSVHLKWDEFDGDESNFTSYEIQRSDTGVGGWATIQTITDKQILSYDDIGLVVQGDVDDFDEDSDTYPNGRKVYYRVKLNTPLYGSYTDGDIDDATTIPAIRPVSLTFTPKSKYWDEDFIDDNLIYTPYGVEVIPEWYDDDDVTDVNHIDKLTVEAYFRGTSTWPGAASETNDFSPVDFVSGGIIKGDVGFKPYKVKGKIYDLGGLYRKATTDKTTEQFDVAWPSPCPVAIPDGAYADAPPALNGRPFSSGDLVPIDLSVSGQQSGETVFKEDFSGAPLDDGKWGFTGSASSPVYGTGVGGAPVLSTIHNGSSSSSLIHKKLLGQTSPSNIYDKYLSKYTGGYRLKTISRFDNTWNFGSVLQFFVSTVMYDSIAPGAFSKGGYELGFQYGSNFMSVIRKGNFVVDYALLASFDLGTDNPLLLANKGKFIYIDIMVSPYYGVSGEGDLITIIYNIDTTLAGVQNIDYETHPYIYTIASLGHSASDQQHYTGRNMITVISTLSQTNALFEIYDVDIIGRVNGQGYGAKNLTNEQILDLVNSPIPSFPISCAPDLASQLCFIEGRIKNEYGAQSRTGEVDDYQGDTFNNAIPIGFLAVPKTGFVGADVLIDASQSIDPEGGVLIYKYDFGDTETLETSQSSVSHQYVAPGTYTVKLIVEDEAGLLSVEVQSIITIYDALGQFDEVSLMSPWESISDSTPPGTSKTSHPELDYDTIQTMEGGNRVFSLTGQHHDPDCDIDLATRMTNAEEEKDYFHTLYNQSKLITLDLVFFGKVRGVITDHKPSMAIDDQQAFQFSMTFQEIDVRQFE